MKNYLRNIFEEGERTNKKANPVTVSANIRNEKDENGNRLFPPNDWLTTQQVRSVFGSLKLSKDKQATKILLEPKTDVDEDLNEVLDELVATENFNVVNSVTEQLL